jgi:hypothetical protein
MPTPFWCNKQDFSIQHSGRDLVVTNKENHLLVILHLVCSTIMVKFYEKWWITEKKSQITDISNFCYWLHQKGIGIYDNTVSSAVFINYSGSNNKLIDRFLL